MIAFDLGSNTLRAVRMDCDTLEITGRYEKIVRTADGLAKTGTIAPEAFERVVAAVKEAQKALAYESGEGVAAVATEAVRQARNGGRLLDEIKRRTGVVFQVIDGKEEAALTLAAVRHRLARLGETERAFTLVDIGGGSTEVTLAWPKRVESRSFRLGIVTLSQSGERARRQSILARTVREMARFYKERGGEGPLVATAGTPTTVAALKLGMDYASYDPQKINGTRVSLQDLSAQKRRLLAADESERKRLVGVGREDLIETGIEIFEALMRAFGVEEAVVIDDGLREGSALVGCRQKAG